MSNLANATKFARTLTTFSRSKHVMLTSLFIDANLFGDFGERVIESLATNPLSQALSHLAVGIDLRHNGSEGLDAAMALEAGNVEMDGHGLAMTRHVAHE